MPSKPRVLCTQRRVTRRIDRRMYRMAVESVAAEFMGRCGRMWLNGNSICMDMCRKPCCITATNAVLGHQACRTAAPQGGSTGRGAMRRKRWEMPCSCAPAYPSSTAAPAAYPHLLPVPHVYAAAAAQQCVTCGLLCAAEAGTGPWQRRRAAQRARGPDRRHLEGGGRRAVGGAACPGVQRQCCGQHFIMSEPR